MTSLKIAIIISFITSLIFGFSDLKRGLILTWGTVIFFFICLILVNLLDNVRMARELAAVTSEE